MFHVDKPYNTLPPLPPETDIETKSVLKACVAARASLAELKAVGNLIPNQAVLINCIPLLEAQASSEIENIVTTADRLFRYADDPERSDIDAATKEALRYRTALNDGFRALAQRPLSTSTAIRVCSTIKNVEMEVRRTPGTALINDANREIVYTPPEGQQHLLNLLANWERYIHDHGVTEPLIRMAVMHYQFEAIHPFTDGNGRTGRVLNLLYLVEQKLLDIPVLYLSRYIIRRKLDYYRLLLGVTSKKDWESWILFMLAAVDETAHWTTTKIRLIRGLLDRTAEKIRRDEPRIYSRELAEIIFAQPYCRIVNLVEAGIAQRQSASVYLKKLVAIGILEERKSGRERLFVNPALIRLLTEAEHEGSAQ